MRLIHTLLLLAGLLAVPGLFAAPAGTPNVIVIVADDLGYSDIGVHGCGDIPTPHIDTLARSGIRFSNGYSSHPFCSPMRAGLMSGRYQHRFGYETNCPYDPQNPHLGFPDKELTIPQRLQKAGYTTAHIGKWHLGAHSSKHPNNRGIDHFYGFLGGGHDYFVADLSVRDHEGYRQALMRNGTPEGVSEYLTTAFSKDACRFIEENKDGSFFLTLAYNAPHTPLQAPEEYLVKFSSIADSKRRRYAAMVHCMDDGIGMVLETLETLKLREKTVVFFLSDNGGPFKSNGSRNLPLRDGKGSVFEGGVRVPFLMSWPGTLPAGTVDDRPVISLDTSVTALHLAGADTSGKLDGVDLMPFVTGGKKGMPHEALFWRMGNGERNAWAVRAGDLKFTYVGRDKEEPESFFDLGQDLGEKQNLLRDRGEDVERLKALWSAWNRENLPPAFPGFGPYHQRKNQFYKDLQDEGDF
jgi:arylsulfatase A-like enzyme